MPMPPGIVLVDELLPPDGPIRPVFSLEMLVKCTCEDMSSQRAQYPTEEYGS
jgi:hypothetical protein